MPNHQSTTYIHGTETAEQNRLRLLNRITNPPFITWLNLKGDERILEVGSGLGVLAGEIAATLNKGSVTGIEFSQSQLAECQMQPNLHYQQGDAHALPFGDAEFDIVYCRYLLEHVSNPQRVVSEMVRVTRPGGTVFAQENDISLMRIDPPCPSFDAVWDAFIHLQRELGGDALIGRRLFGLFRRAGLMDISLSLQPQIHWFGEENFKPWVANIAGNVESARSALVNQKRVESSAIDAAIAELMQLTSNPEASCLFHWNRAVGRTKVER